ncbi:hypothetical protein BDN72DRAFT_864626 [Pluteus cervinus]|uniref:Uncharacterized protein n=1 Tax=Pluteus cervinus TaxID=181527 RepID=A0ACD3A371_9AGAR|nr:hypothetical protein BDN72DRAFT_864626 [Pluteus cervinus]
MAIVRVSILWFEHEELTDGVHGVSVGAQSATMNRAAGNTTAQASTRPSVAGRSPLEPYLPGGYAAAISSFAPPPQASRSRNESMANQQANNAQMVRVTGRISGPRVTNRSPLITPTEELWDFAVLPFGIPDSTFNQDTMLTQVKPYKFSADVQLIKNLLECLENNGLLFTVSIPGVARSPEALWELMDAQLKAIMEQHRLAVKQELAPQSNTRAAEPGSFSGLSWRILNTKKQNGGQTYVLSSSTLMEVNFHIEGLRADKSLRKIANHYHPDRPLFWIGFRFGNVRGPISGLLLGAPSNEIHSCFPFQVYRFLRMINESQVVPCDQFPCEGTPSAGQSQSPTRRALGLSDRTLLRHALQRQVTEEGERPSYRAALLAHEREAWPSRPSPSATSLQSAHISQRAPRPIFASQESGRRGLRSQIDDTGVGDDANQRDAEMLDEGHRTETGELGGIPASMVRRPAGNPYFTEMDEWKTTVTRWNSEGMVVRPDTADISFSGPTCDVLVDAVIGLTIFHSPGGGGGTAHLGGEYIPPAGVILNNVPPSRWISISTKIRIGTTARGGSMATGNAPLRLVLQSSITKLTDIEVSGSFWSLSESYHTIDVFTEGICPMDRKRTLWASGVLVAAFMYKFLLGAYPISPFLILVCMCKSMTVLQFLTFEDVEALDPEKATTLQPWFDNIKSLDSVVSATDVGDPFLVLLRSCEMRSTNFRAPRSQAAHASLTQGLLGKVLLGHANVFIDEGISFFADGLDMRLEGGQGLMKSFRTPPGSRDEQDFKMRSEKAIRFVRGLYNRQILSVEDVLEALEFTTSDVENTANKLIFDLFQDRVVTWLRGRGHPAGSALEQAAVPSESPELFRARAFVKALSECVLLPANPARKLKVALTGVQSFKDGAGMPIAEVHACFNEVVVHVYNDWLLANLTNRSAEGQTEFEKWWHVYIMHNSGRYPHPTAFTTCDRGEVDRGASVITFIINGKGGIDRSNSFDVGSAQLHTHSCQTNIAEHVFPSRSPNSSVNTSGFILQTATTLKPENATRCTNPHLEIEPIEIIL